MLSVDHAKDAELDDDAWSRWFAVAVSYCKYCYLMQDGSDVLVRRLEGVRLLLFSLSFLRARADAQRESPRSVSDGVIAL